MVVVAPSSYVPQFDAHVGDAHVDAHVGAHDVASLIWHYYTWLLCRKTHHLPSSTFHRKIESNLLDFLLKQFTKTNYLVKNIMLQCNCCFTIKYYDFQWFFQRFSYFNIKLYHIGYMTLLMSEELTYTRTSRKSSKIRPCYELKINYIKP